MPQAAPPLPAGFGAYVANIGVKDNRDDYVVIDAGAPIPTAAVFTKSRFAGPSVTISQNHVADLTARAVIIISKNANVANGTDGLADAHAVVTGVSQALRCDPADVLLASTGVIGRRYPIDKMLAGIAATPPRPDSPNASAAAAGIMTTDTHPKVATATVGGSAARVVGIAKGVGMIEPDMATMIAVITTDAAIEPQLLDRTFRAVVDQTFNCVSIDSDTSTSDTAIVMASGAAGSVDHSAFTAALGDVCETLTKMIAADGEGAATLIEVVIEGARDDQQAKLVAKAIVNSPLVKTAVHGADPNWGRVAMAIGKTNEPDIDQARVRIRFGTTEVYPTRVDETDLAALSAYMASDEVVIGANLGIANGSARVWGCDLTAGYIRINADYTT